ncbi:MAG: RNA 2',3'-cyclic phosphodiesterase [Gammaproteobacteria bacterium]|nr:RNA 2',3'-cyclic phosphodiesterase [Gammaproteobacteria bacterium]
MTSERKRLFFGVWPDAGTRRALEKATQAAVRASGGKPVAGENLHLTLAFLHSVEVERLEGIGRAAATLSGAPVELELDRIGHWPRSRILWIAPSRPPRPLPELVASLWQALEPCGFAPEERVYLPHVTLARKANPPKAQGRLQPVAWRIDRFALAESITSGNRSVYRILEEWPLSQERVS